MSAEMIKGSKQFEVIDLLADKFYRLTEELNQVITQVDELILIGTDLADQQWYLYLQNEYERGKELLVKMNNVGTQIETLQEKSRELEQKISELLHLNDQANALMSKSISGEIETPEA